MKYIKKAGFRVPFRSHDDSTLKYNQDKVTQSQSPNPSFYGGFTYDCEIRKFLMSQVKQVLGTD
jgi:hypothetical protein